MNDDSVVVEDAEKYLGMVAAGDRDDDVVDGSQQWRVVGVIGNARLGNDIVAAEDAEVDVVIVAGIVAGDDGNDVVVVDGSQQ